MNSPLRLAQRAIRSQLGQNILTNYLAVLWMGGLTLGLIPVYLARLGADQWGVVALCIAIQGFVSLLDTGLAQIMPRDVARVAGDRAAEAKVFNVFSHAYLGLAVSGFVIGQISVPWLIEHWFNLAAGLRGSASWALRLVLLQFLFQFANNANTGFWSGIQAQKEANWRQCGFASAKHGGALIAVFAWRPDAVHYLLPFVLFSFVEWWANRRTIRRLLGDAVQRYDVSMDDYRLLVREAGLLAVGVLIGMLAAQLDRLVLSRVADVAAFGRYVIVANLGLAFMQLQYPLMRAYLPRQVRDPETTGGSSNRQLAVGVLGLCVLPCVLVAALAPWLLQLWVRDGQIVAEGTAPLRLILLAVAVNALYNLIYQQIVLRGDSRFVVLINLATLLIVGPLVTLLARELGILAGGLAWVLTALVQSTFAILWLVKLRRRTS